MAENTGDNQEFHIVDLAATEGYLVDDSDEDDPVLITPDGQATAAIASGENE